MSATDVRNKFLQLASQVGRAGVSAAFPNDFEYYSIMFELVDSKDRVVDLLVFPVMPNSVKEDRHTNANVKKAAAGVISLYNPSFVPFPINLSGTFGRRFRLLIGQTETIQVGINTADSTLNYKPFNVAVKTGYGVSKVLEGILQKSYLVDDNGKPMRLFFYNQSFNSSYLVEVKNFNISMNMANNMMWDYSVHLEAIAPASAIRSNQKSSLIKLMGFNALQKQLTSIIDLGFANLHNSLNKLKS